MQKGVEIIYQGALLNVPWMGYADFLVRVDGKTRLGNFGYEVLDTKLARSPQAKYAIQLCVYSRLLGFVQQQLPNKIHVVLGDSSQVSFLLAQLMYYAERAQRRIESFAASPPGNSVAAFTASRAIVDLLSRGKRVGVSSNSHKAINTLLDEVERLAAQQRLKFHGVKKCSEDDHRLNGRFIEDVTDNETVISGSYDLIAGTAWLFSRPEIDQALDYVFIDEGGQVSLANVVAIATSAHNLVVIGDQMQLAQPTQGVHPGESGCSALEYALKNVATVPPSLGIFLDKTRRMHPDVCRFISDAFYDSRLQPDSANSRQRLILAPDADKAYAPTGLRFIDVNHTSCSQSSEAEAISLSKVYRDLLKQRWIDREGRESQINLTDILVVTPYNMQVDLLRHALPAGARVGTVDKFQGQEAAVVLISMATSSAEDMPRNIEFLFSRNRLNVAISRARCLAVLFANPRLLDAPCSTIEQMQLVNALCWAKAYAESTSIRRASSFVSNLAAERRQQKAAGP
jgi:uncharacterized protein